MNARPSSSRIEETWPLIERRRHGVRRVQDGDRDVRALAQRPALVRADRRARQDLVAVAITHITWVTTAVGPSQGRVCEHVRAQEVRGAPPESMTRWPSCSRHPRDPRRPRPTAPDESPLPRSSRRPSSFERAGASSAGHVAARDSPGAEQDPADAMAEATMPTTSHRPTIAGRGARSGRAGGPSLGG